MIRPKFEAVKRSFLASNHDAFCDCEMVFFSKSQAESCVHEIALMSGSDNSSWGTPISVKAGSGILGNAGISSCACSSEKLSGLFKINSSLSSLRSVSWCSRVEPSGTFPKTVFVDWLPGSMPLCRRFTVR